MEQTNLPEKKITTVQKWKQESSEISVHRRAITPIQAFDSPQVALLLKEEPIYVGTAMTAVLIALSKRKKCAWDEDTVSDVASAILNDFNMLRFEEFIYIFRQGIKGRYGKVTFAELTESDLGIWITKYMETERLEAEELYRNKFKLAFQARMEEVDELVPKEKFAELAHKYKVNDILERSENARDTGQKEFDQKRAAYFIATKGGWTDKQLLEDLAVCETHGFTETAKAISFEIKVRAIPKAIYALAEKIINGGEMNEEELQLQKNHPQLLEAELNRRK